MSQSVWLVVYLLGIRNCWHGYMFADCAVYSVLDSAIAVLLPIDRLSACPESSPSIASADFHMKSKRQP
jgi:hypothetical protein